MGNPFIRGYGTVWALQTCAGCNQRQSVSASNGFHCAESIIPLTRTPLSPIWGFVLLERVWHGTKAMNVRVIWTPVVLHVVFILLILFFFADVRTADLPGAGLGPAMDPRDQRRQQGERGGRCSPLHSGHRPSGGSEVMSGGASGRDERGASGERTKHGEQASTRRDYGSELSAPSITTLTPATSSSNPRFRCAPHNSSLGGTSWLEGSARILISSAERSTSS